MEAGISNPKPAMSVRTAVLESEFTGIFSGFLSKDVKLTQNKSSGGRQGALQLAFGAAGAGTAALCLSDATTSFVTSFPPLKLLYTA
jgi:hypothetical protein